MPWTVSAIFMATTLGVPTIEYLPWAIFGHFLYDRLDVLAAAGSNVPAHRVWPENARNSRVSFC